MVNEFKDITSKLGEAKWFDALGYPRYCKFHPNHVHNIYCDYVALLLVKCQDCGKQIQVSVNLSKTKMYTRQFELDLMGAYFKAKEQKTKQQKGDILGKLFDDKKPVNFPALTRKYFPNKRGENYFRYGDPPWHNNSNGEFCHAGGTMSAETIRVLQFWVKNRKTWEWERNNKYETVYMPNDIGRVIKKKKKTARTKIKTKGKR